MVVIRTIIFVTLLLQLVDSKECIRRDYNHGSYVCVCNATYCDTVDPVQPTAAGKYVIYTSNKDGLRFSKSEGAFASKPKQPANQKQVLTVNAGKKYQTILGWGGAFTDTATYNIQQLNKGAKEQLLKSYFSKEGLEYSMGRAQISCSDFSLRYYSYDETANDVNLTKFNLTDEDYLYKIPIIKEAMKLSNNTLQLFATAWSPPLWMKTNNHDSGIGFVKREYYDAWAKYHVKFLDAYRKEGIRFWGLTTGNEPTLGLSPFFTIISLGWMPWDQGTWLSEYLGPAIRNNPEYSNLKIIALDDERLLLPFWLIAEYFNNNASRYTDGIGVHWYTDNYLPSLLSLTHAIYPDKFLINTEACTGDKRYKQKVLLGNWRRGEEYVEDILEDLNHWVAGWLDWNLALNLQGGPTYSANYVDSSIIVNVTAQEFYKQSTFYAMGHFSKFVPPGSVKIDSKFETKAAHTMAFLRPDNGTVVIVYNRHNRNLTITIHDERRGYTDVPITQRSINTILYW